MNSEQHERARLNRLAKGKTVMESPHVHPQGAVPSGTCRGAREWIELARRAPTTTRGRPAPGARRALFTCTESPASHQKSFGSS